MTQYILENWKWIAGALVGVALLVFGLWPELLLGRRGREFVGKELMTPNELEFFRRIEKALPDFYIFPQVALSAIVDVNPMITSSANPKTRSKGRALRNQFAQKRLDYLICDGNLEPICIIELDDRSHVQSKDEIRDAMNAQAGYATLRYWSDKARRPSSAEIRKDVLKIAS